MIGEVNKTSGSLFLKQCFLCCVSRGVLFRVKCGHCMYLYNPRFGSFAFISIFPTKGCSICKFPCILN